MKLETGLTLPPIVAIVGPTAVGKSSLALALAAEFNAEIISADSRQVYQYMDIGTAKPTREEQVAVRHHLIDVTLPDDTYSVTRFQEDAGRALRDVSACGKTAFVVGGTGYYIQALLDRTDIPHVPPDPELRSRLESELETEGLQALMQRLVALDAASAGRIDATNPRRVIRALEIIAHTNAPIPPVQRHPLDVLYLGMNSERARLYTIADRRVESQVARGLIEETERLVRMGYALDLPSLNSLAYREMGSYLRGSLTREQAVEAYKRSTHRLIRRQLTWFRSDPRIEWHDAAETRLPELVAQRIHRYLAAKAG